MPDPAVHENLRRVGGLDWEDVKPLVTQYLGELNIPVIVYTTYHKGVAADEGL